jgi:exonuclease III
MKIITWNMDYWKRNQDQRFSAWDHLTKILKPEIALLQEIVPPEDSYSKYNLHYRKIDGKRNTFRIPTSRSLLCTENADKP